MKSTLLTGALLLAGSFCYAQFSLTPQVGFEQARANLNYNSLTTSSAEGAFRAALKMDYRLKGGHGPYINLGTSPAPVVFNFDNAGQLVKGVEQASSNMQFRMEAGYQYTSKAIKFGKGGSKKSSTPAETVTETTVVKQSCGSYVYRSHCTQRKMTKTAPVDKTFNMRLQPSVGVAYLPAADQGIKQTANGFEYAASWKTAVTPAMGFEFARGKQRLFTLNVFYTQPLNMQEESFTTTTGAKAVTTTLSPNASTWGMTLGVPFSFTKSNTVKTKEVKKVKKECSRTTYRRCIRM